MKLFLMIVLLTFLAFAGFVYYAASPSHLAESFPREAVIHYPWGEANPPLRPSLKVMTYNIGYASGEKNNLAVPLSREEVQLNLEQMAAEIKKANPDIVCMQEVDFGSQRTFSINQMEFLAHALGMTHGAYVITWNKKYLPWPYWPLSAQYGKILSGQAVLSRYPINAQETFAFPKPASNAFWYNWFYLDRIVQKISVQAGDLPLRIWNVHLEAFDPKSRGAQVKTLAAHFLEDHWPYQLVLGDFNSASFKKDASAAEDKGEALNAFIEETELTNAERAPFYTMPSWDPANKIDHVLFNEGFELKEVGSFESTASDHLPVWAELDWVL